MTTSSSHTIFFGFIFGTNGDAASGSYGWFDLHFDTGTDTWSITDGAYESVAGNAITYGAKAGAATVPEPGTGAAALIAAAAGLLGYRRRVKKLALANGDNK